jgi:hypothetical protein
MKVYQYQASLYCEECGIKIIEDLGDPPHDWPWDSGDHPVGPENASEADSPQSCGACGIFLGNPLTDDGGDYVIEQFTTRDTVTEVMREWAEFYDYLNLSEIEEVRDQLHLMTQYMEDTPDYGNIVRDRIWWAGEMPASPEYYVPQDWQSKNRPIVLLWIDYLAELKQFDERRLAEAKEKEDKFLDLLIASETEMNRRNRS